MDTIKKKIKWVWKYVWSLIKISIPSTIIYACAGAILMMLTMKGDESLKWDTAKLGWTALAWVMGIGYNVAAAYSQGIIGYDMLASGNMQRRAEDRGMSMRIGQYKEEQEYRPWKGFVAGVLTAIIPVLFALLFGAKSDIINNALTSTESPTDTSVGMTVLFGFLLSGCTLLPAFYLNASSIPFNYYLTALFALVPILVTGFAYIGGAYGKRNKVLRAQEKKSAELEAKQNKQAKVNYGGLPGTKPKKRK